MKVIVCMPLPTGNDCCACGAGFQLASPAWLASITQVPTAVNDTVEPEIEHTEAAAASMVNATVRPDDAVAVTL